MSSVPKDPFGPLTEGAASMHELFLSLTAAGFTRREALFLLACMIAQGTEEGL